MKDIKTNADLTALLNYLVVYRHEAKPEFFAAQDVGSARQDQ